MAEGVQGGRPGGSRAEAQGKAEGVRPPAQGGVQQLEDVRQVRRGQRTAAATAATTAAEAADVDVEGDGEVGVVAHPEVAGDLRVPPHHLVDERVGQVDVDRLREVLARVGEGLDEGGGQFEVDPP